MPSAAADKCIISHIGGYTSDHAEYPRCFWWLRRRLENLKSIDSCCAAAGRKQVI